MEHQPYASPLEQMLLATIGGLVLTGIALTWWLWAMR